MFIFILLLPFSAGRSSVKIHHWRRLVCILIHLNKMSSVLLVEALISTKSTVFTLLAFVLWPFPLHRLMRLNCQLGLKGLLQSRI